MEWYLKSLKYSDIARPIAGACCKPCPLEPLAKIKFCCCGCEPIIRLIINKKIKYYLIKKMFELLLIKIIVIIKTTPSIFQLEIEKKKIINYQKNISLPLKFQNLVYGELMLAKFVLQIRNNQLLNYFLIYHFPKI